MYLTQPKEMISDASSPTISEELLDMEWRNDYQNRVPLVIEVSGTFTGLVLKEEISLDGSNWHEGNTINDTGLHSGSSPTPYYRLNVTAISSGSVTVKIC